MSTWRKKAIEILPELKKVFNNKATTIYEVFIELLPATIQAHQQNNPELLRKYYDYAKWCFQQKEKDLWNAAGVVFYEHLGDFEETFTNMHLWIDKQVYNEIKGLLQLRLSPDKFLNLEKRYREYS
jgi:hypothetical protein